MKKIGDKHLKENKIINENKLVDESKESMEEERFPSRWQFEWIIH